jgi:hypothetical protein
MLRAMADANEPRWLVLIHQLPPKPEYLRVKIWRRLQKIGAVALKNAVYVLPRSDGCYEDFEWTLREVTEAGGEGTLCEARFVEGLSDDRLIALFHAARESDYATLAEDLRKAASAADLARLTKRFNEILEIDFFEAPGRIFAKKLLAELEGKVRRDTRAKEAEHPSTTLRGRMWVTRKGIHVDRMACAWLIRRFIDPDGRIKLVPGKSYRPEPGELRFDMFEGEYTHEGDRCSFEVLLLRCGVRDRALDSLAEIIHDLDLKDDKFGREETIGLGLAIDAIALAHKEDEERLRRSAELFNDLYEWFRRKRAT